jgi:hypothetical protein
VYFLNLSSRSRGYGRLRHSPRKRAGVASRFPVRKRTYAIRSTVSVAVCFVVGDHGVRYCEGPTPGRPFVYVVPQYRLERLEMISFKTDRLGLHSHCFSIWPPCVPKRTDSQQPSWLSFCRHELSEMPEPFRPLDHLLCEAAFFLVGIAAVPLMAAWIR